MSRDLVDRLRDAAQADIEAAELLARGEREQSYDPRKSVPGPSRPADDGFRADTSRSTLRQLGDEGLFRGSP